MREKKPCLTSNVSSSNTVDEKKEEILKILSDIQRLPFGSILTEEKRKDLIKRIKGAALHLPVNFIFIAPEVERLRAEIRNRYYSSDCLSLDIYAWHDLMAERKAEKKKAAIEGFVYKDLSLSNRCRLTFSRYNSIPNKNDKNEIEDNPKAINRYWFFYTISEGFETQLSFQEIFQQIRKDIDAGEYKQALPSQYYEHHIPTEQDYYDNIAAQGKQITDADRKYYDKRLDEWTIDALYKMPTFFRSQEPGIRLLRGRFEKRSIDLYHGTREEKSSAARFFRDLTKKRNGNQKIELPDSFYLSGLINFLLPIAWYLRDKYKQAFGDKIISRHDAEWKNKIQSVDQRLLPLVSDGTLPELLADPKLYIKQTLLPKHPKFIKLNTQFIKERLKNERKG